MGCGRSRPKQELARYVRAGDAVVADPEGRRPGRGAYLCPRPECAERALRGRGFNRSFRAAVTVPQDVIDLID